MDARELFKNAVRLRKQGQATKALALLRETLRRNALDAEGVERAGRFIHKELARGEAPPDTLDVLLLGQCTTSWLAHALSAVTWARGAALRVSEGEYDNVLQELSGFPPNSKRPDVIALLPWHQRLFGSGERTPKQRIEDELGFWREAWRIVTERLGVPLLQAGYDWIVPGALGRHLSGAPGGEVQRVRELNAALRAELPRGAYFLDLEQVSGAFGRERFYDPRRYHWTKQPFSEHGARVLAEHLWAGIRALRFGPKKVLVVDLDNTLWGGVVGETGPLEIALGESAEGEAYRAFQEHLRALRRRGVLLAVASKNNPADAREPFEKNPEMALRLEDFAAFEANWEPKDRNLLKIAETLKLGLESFVFFDDNPAERERVRQALPEVEVVEVPEDPAEYVRALQGGLWFEAAALTEADRERGEQYRAEGRRRAQRQSFDSLEAYLRSLEMRGQVRPIGEADLPRVVQLIGKTNQFNLTTRRHSREDVERMLALPGVIPLTLRMKDKFGEHGMVSVMLGVPAGPSGQDARATHGNGQDARATAQAHSSETWQEEKTVRVDTWLMSCRVIGRGAEQFFFGAFLERAKALGYRRILGEYIPTKKNAPVSGLYDALGFRKRPGKDGDEAVLYELDVERARPPKTFLKSSD